VVRDSYHEEDLMSTAADQIIDALRAQHDALAAFTADLDERDVNRPSGAVDWTVAQVLSHLGSGAEIALAALEASLTGVDPRGPEFAPSVWDRWNAKSSAQMAADFAPANLALVARYESIDDATRAAMRIDLGFLPEPVDLATAAGLRLNEFTLHSWDVLVAFDASATLPVAGPSVLIDRVALLFGWLGHADALNGKRGVLAVHTREPERDFGVELSDAVRLVDEPADPDAVLILPAEAWLRLIAGRLGPDHTPASVRIEGDLISLDELRTVFPGY
jgi:uncharacterized protein (TIGR03083 family)